MHIAIATTYTPLVTGGAEFLSENLMQACQIAGYDVSLLRYPFSDASTDLIKLAMQQWQSEDFRLYGPQQPDMVICLKFPAFYLQHPCRINWILHQHRSFYELWDWRIQQGFRPQQSECDLRERVMAEDQLYIESAIQNRTISETVSKRLQHYNQIEAQAIYHPPPLDALLSPASRIETADYIFAPSRLEPLKRQALLIEALSMTRHPVKAVICGQGSQRAHLQALIAHYQLTDRVQLLQHVTEDEMVRLYRGAAAVFFAPYDEDYGYVTLEAMAAAKPVITCFDSGGPTEFVVDNQTGYVEAPEPLYLAQRMDKIYSHKEAARAMGDNAYQHYRGLNLNWPHVVEQLVS